MKRQALLDALEIVKPGLSNKDMIEQATSFAFMNDRVVTFNDEISISHPCADMDITGAVRAEELYKLLNRIKKEDIELSVEEGELRLNAGKARAGISLQEEIKMPLEEIGKIGRYYKMPEGLLLHIKFAMFSCSRDMSRPVLTCINVKKDGTVESSDNYRITRCQGEKLPVGTFLISATSARELTKLPPDGLKIAAGDGWMHFKTKFGTIFSCRTFADDFPDVSKFLKVEGEEIKLPKTLEEVLDKASIFTKQEFSLTEHVELTLKEKKMTIRGKNESGWFEQDVNLRYSGPELSLFINPVFLREVSSITKKCTLGENRIRFEGDGWEHVVMLVAK